MRFIGVCSILIAALACSDDGTSSSNGGNGGSAEGGTAGGSDTGGTQGGSDQGGNPGSGGAVAGAGGGNGGSGGTTGGAGGTSAGGMGGASAGGAGGTGGTAGTGGSSAPRRLVIFTSTLGIYRPSLAKTFSGTDATGWERSVIADSVELGPVLAPAADLRPHLLVVDGLTLHVSLNENTNNCVDPITGPYSGLTGDFGCKAKPSPSLDWLIAQANHPAAGVSLLRVGPYPRMSFDGAGAVVPGLSGAIAAHQALFPAQAACAPKPAPATNATALDAWADQVIAVVVDGLRCDRTRVATINLGSPTAQDLGASFTDFHQEVGDQLGGDNPNAGLVATFTKYNTMSLSAMARLARALKAVPEGTGTLFDSTLLVWIADEAGPAHILHPWNMVVLAGSKTGVQAGRYLRVAQNVVTVEPFVAGTTMLGTSHNHALVSVARAMGLNLNSVGLQSLQQKNGAPTLDLTGPLSGF